MTFYAFGIKLEDLPTEIRIGTNKQEMEKDRQIGIYREIPVTILRTFPVSKINISDIKNAMSMEALK